MLVSFGVLVKNRFSSVGVGTGFFPVTSGPESALISSSGLVWGFLGLSTWVLNPNALVEEATFPLVSHEQLSPCLQAGVQSAVLGLDMVSLC